MKYEISIMHKGMTEAVKLEVPSDCLIMVSEIEKINGGWTKVNPVWKNPISNEKSRLIEPPTFQNNEDI